ncbi:MAG: hypothetical protein NC416_11220 [Eubacterium sp.]|nr:hypothetical protein [Eubacterium sp.]
MKHTSRTYARLQHITIIAVLNGQPAAICYKHDAMAFGSGIVDVEREIRGRKTLSLADRHCHCPQLMVL